MALPTFVFLLVVCSHPLSVFEEAGSKHEEWSDLGRRVSSLAIDCLRSRSPSCFFHQRFVNWHVSGRAKRNCTGWSRRGTSGISHTPHQNWLTESPRSARHCGEKLREAQDTWKIHYERFFHVSWASSHTFTPGKTASGQASSTGSLSLDIHHLAVLVRFSSFLLQAFELIRFCAGFQPGGQIVEMNAPA